jgi:hypothetical protein
MRIVAGQWDRFGRQGAAVHEQRGSGRCVGDGELAHDAAAQADDLVRDPLAQLGPVDAGLGEAEQGDEDAQFEVGRRGRAGADRQVAVDEQVGAGQVVSALVEQCRGPGDVAGPLRPLGGVQYMERSGVGGVEPAGVGAQQPVVAAAGRDVGAQVQGDGQCEPSL